MLNLTIRVVLSQEHVKVIPIRIIQIIPNQSKNDLITF